MCAHTAEDSKGVEVQPPYLSDELIYKPIIDPIIITFLIIGNGIKEWRKDAKSTKV